MSHRLFALSYPNFPYISYISIIKKIDYLKPYIFYKIYKNVFNSSGNRSK